MNAAWWWIDRWRKSTAYTDMSAEEQGLYRNLLDEIWLREDHCIPDDPKILAKVSGDFEAWNRCGNNVLKWLKKTRKGWTNDTALEVISQSNNRAEKQKRYRDRLRNKDGNGAGNTDGSPSPSPSPSLISVSEEKKISKKKFGEFLNVFLSDEEYSKLIERFGKEGAGDKIETLSGYIASKGKKYKSHYATILNWARKDEAPACQEEEDVWL